MSQLTSYWFPAKRHGWGWGAPVAWQGWVVLVAFLLAVSIGIIRIGARNPVACAFWVMAMSLLLVLICYLKGEPPRWRARPRS